MKSRKKLIEVALPLVAINSAAAREKSIRHGHPSTLHLWWARRPLAAARAVIFAQMVDDPSANPDLFPTEKAQEKERKRLFKIIEDLVQWENTTNERVLEAARNEIWQSWRRACADNVDHPRAKELFNRQKLPAFQDPFAGGGTIPLEAQRLGLEAYASDLNPVAVLINKAMIEIPAAFTKKLPVNPEAQRQVTQMGRLWQGAAGFASDIRYYGQWVRDQAEKRIGHLYPKVEVTAEIAEDRPDLRPFLGQKLTVVAWIWARTVKSPNPAFAGVHVPLASTFMLSEKSGKEAYVEPIIAGSNYKFRVKIGLPPDFSTASNGTKMGRGASFRCLLSNTPIDQKHIRDAFVKKETGRRLMAIVAESPSGRTFLAPSPEHEEAAERADPSWRPEIEMNPKSRDLLSGRGYGFKYWHELFTERQLVALTTFSDLIDEVRTVVAKDAMSQDSDGSSGLNGKDTEAIAYPDAIAVYLAFALDKMTDTNTALCSWQVNPPRLRATFGRQALPMVWDYAEANIFGDAAGDYARCIQSVAEVLESGVLPCAQGHSEQADVQTLSYSEPRLFSTDPPYYDNISYADLSDFFYLWLRRTGLRLFPSLFATVAVPKDEELVAAQHRHGSKKSAEAFFLSGMTKAMSRIADLSFPLFPVTIYYAFKQSENEGEGGVASTGWETFLEAVIRSGLGIGGTWPMRSELATRNVSRGNNALASSIILVCRAKDVNAPSSTRREFIKTLKLELPAALAHLQKSNIAPVDLAQAAIGPGMAVYTRFSRVLDASGQVLTVRDALTLINETLDEVLAEQEGDFDSDTRFALAWFDQSGFVDGDYGVADVLARAKNTSVDGMRDAGILVSGRGKVRLLRPDELPGDWDPENDSRLTVWEMVHHLIRVLESGGESAAAVLVAKLGSKAEVARELAYRLYTICERKKRALEGLSYNALVQSWPEIIRLARENVRPAERQAEIFEQA